jgi:excisionase family DNA binding protein
MNLSDLKKLEVMKPWVAPGEAAAILGVSRQRVTELLNDGKLESFPFLGSRHVLLSSIIQRLEQRCKIPPKARKLLQ